MTTRATIDAFLALDRFALVGASRTGKKFGNTLAKELTKQGYSLRLVHPHVDTLDGQPCAKSLQSLNDVQGALLVTPPAQTEQLVREAHAAGITHIWMQQGAESAAAIRYCDEHGLQVVHHECILMFARASKFPHSFHRRLRGWFGKLPQ